MNTTTTAVAVVYLEDPDDSELICPVCRGQFDEGMTHLPTHVLPQRGLRRVPRRAGRQGHPAARFAGPPSASPRAPLDSDRDVVIVDSDSDSDGSDMDDDEPAPSYFADTNGVDSETESESDPDDDDFVPESRSR